MGFAELRSSVALNFKSGMFAKASNCIFMYLLVVAAVISKPTVTS